MQQSQRRVKASARGHPWAPIRIRTNHFISQLIYQAAGSARLEPQNSTAGLKESIQIKNGKLHSKRPPSVLCLICTPGPHPINLMYRSSQTPPKTSPSLLADPILLDSDSPKQTHAYTILYLTWSRPGQPPQIIDPTSQNRGHTWSDCLGSRYIDLPKPRPFRPSTFQPRPTSGSDWPGRAEGHRTPGHLGASAQGPRQRGRRDARPGGHLGGIGDGGMA